MAEQGSPNFAQVIEEKFTNVLLTSMEDFMITDNDTLILATVGLKNARKSMVLRSAENGLLLDGYL